MFGKGKQPAPHPAAPPAPWALAFLTTDYLVSGTVQPERYNLGGTDCFTEACNNSGTGIFHRFSMSDVQLEPAGPQTVAPGTLPNWNLGLCENLVAVIPNDDPSRQAAQHAFRTFQQPRSAVMYAGPYLISGTLLTNPAGGPLIFEKQR